MGLRLSKEDSEKIEVPMASMIDVVFLLLIYFIWTYEIEAPEAHLMVNLPGAPEQTEEQPPPQPPVRVEIHSDGYYFRGRPYDLDMMRRTLVTIGQNDPEATVIIQVSKRAPTEMLIHLLDRCKAAGLGNLNVVTL